MRCLVTGGAGFLGSHVARELLTAGHTVVVLDDLSGGFRANVPDGAELVVGSVCDERLVDDLFVRGQFDYVYHLAAYAAEGLSHFVRHFNYENNLVGSINVINASIRHPVRCFVFTSSIAVYGTNQLPMHEGLTPQPEDPYGIAKWAVEQDLAAARHQFGLPYVAFRPHNVYGEGQNTGDRYRNVVGIFMNQVLRGEPLTVFGDGTQTRSFTYVGDVAPAIAGCVSIPQAYGEVFNVGADKPYSVNDVALAVCQAMGVEPRIRYVPARLEVKHAYACHDKARDVLSFVPRTDLPEGLARMAAWAHQTGVRETPPFARIEIDAGLPNSWT